MSRLLTNQSLDHLNTFAVSAKTAFLLELDDAADWALYCSQLDNNLPRLVLGGGSNLLFLNDYQGLVIRPLIRGIELIEEDNERQRIIVKVGAGENWHQFVRYAIDSGWYGLENLSLIPGTVGAAPIQNIGAYGVEVKDCIEFVELLDLESNEALRWQNADCQFGYRDSRMKRAGQGKYLVTHVGFRLNKIFQPILNYQPLQSKFTGEGRALPTATMVSDAVCEIRRGKLPDPEQLPNAGSFFKNPIVSAEKWRALSESWPGLVAYPNGDDYKLAAGWLIEQAGLKGQQFGPVGIHRHQALVLVNHNKGSGAQLWQLAQRVMDTVAEQFGVMLEPEVRLIGQDSE